MKWWEKFWNPVEGCTHAGSPGCDNCYAKALHDQRHKAYLGGKDVKAACYSKPFEVVQCLEERLKLPLGWREPKRVFVNSMSDLFHEAVPDEFLDRVFAVMALASNHTFYVLTKRPERMRDFIRDTLAPSSMTSAFAERMPRFLFGRSRCPGRKDDGWPFPNVWLGVTAENQEQADARIPILFDTPAYKRFVSVEPMLGPVDLSDHLGVRGERICPDCLGSGRDDLSLCTTCYGTGRFGLDWVICGGESGPSARPMHPDWARSLRDQCESAGVPFFFKQWSPLVWFPVPDEFPCDGSSVFCRVRRNFIGSRDPVGSPANPDGLYAAKVVKGCRGLDGREHNDIPEASHGQVS